MNPSAETAADAPACATIVPEDRRTHFLPSLFGRSCLLIGEMTVYRFMDQLSPDYHGGLWNFLEQEGSPLYLRPATDKRFRIACATNDYSGEVSADAAGIIATLVALSHLSFSDATGTMADAFHRLYDFASNHPEAREILSAID